MGHAFELVLADVCARFEALAGRPVSLWTGAHEASLGNATDEAPVPRLPAERSRLRDRLGVMRGLGCNAGARGVAAAGAAPAGSSAGVCAVEALWARCVASGDIYLGHYSGWYCSREDRFVDSQEALEAGFVDQVSGEPLLRLEQPSYFFRLSRHGPAVLDLLASSDDGDCGFLVMQPEYRKMFLKRLRRLSFQDVPITRPNLATARAPATAIVEAAAAHSSFCALALANASARRLEPEAQASSAIDLLLVGREALWSRAVLWPAILMSAGLPLPRRIWAHGMLMGPDRRSMSHSFGNVVNPHDILDTVPADSLRWYLIRAGAVGDAGGQDMPGFDTEELRRLHDEELRALGNIVQRAMVLSARYCQGCVPNVTVDEVTDHPFDPAELLARSAAAVRGHRLSEAAGYLAEATKATDAWLLRLEPWKLEEKNRQPILRVLFEAVFALAHLYAAFTPAIADALARKFGTPPLQRLEELDRGFGSLLKPGSSVASDSALLKAIEVIAESGASEKMPDGESPRPSEASQAASPGKAPAAPESSTHAAWAPDVCPAGRILPEGLQLYLFEKWSPGILVRGAKEGFLGDHQIVDERVEYEAMLERIAPGEQCVDVGGHIGTLSAALADAAPGVRVVAVEPDPASCAVFQENVAWRELSDRVTLLHGALRERRKASTTLYRAPLNASVNSCVPVLGRDAIQVPVVTVSDVLTACAAPPTVLKMDIEGGEYEVLPPLLAACPELRLLSLELHFTKRVFRDHLAPALTEMLELFGFRRLDGKHRPRHEGVGELTHWERAPDAPRVALELLPPLLALWRHSRAGSMARMERGRKEAPESSPP
eukprot:TRINITY_DN66178_c0_g1_i1.p1 TRINITY_DN66178_c0_g1~~TRINITY_DN66178_c0_g1_i1.p1  ORF type:complete len:948 (+),score=193.19 TRINITY_DN66178_c0_g1_i1:350-2845(+)